MTQKELAEKTGSTVRAISYYEREAKNPTMELLEKMATALEVPVRTFVVEKATFVGRTGRAPAVIKSLRQVLPNLPKLPRKKQESLVVVIKGLLSDEPDDERAN